MATVKEIKATARPKAGKGAARSERRAGRVPGVIYGDNKPPQPVSLEYADLRQKIYAGRFLTTVYDIEVDGAKQRVIPRDFQLDAVRDNPLHVDFMRIGEGAVIRVNVPVRVLNADQAPAAAVGWDGYLTVKGALRAPAPLRALASLASSRRPEGPGQGLGDHVRRADLATARLHVNCEHRGGRGREARHRHLTSGAEALSAVRTTVTGVVRSRVPGPAATRPPSNAPRRPTVV